MKFIFAPDSFKGSMTAEKIIEILEQEAMKSFPGCVCISLPMADGGEGTMDILHNICGGKYVECMVSDPLFQPITARYSVIHSGEVLIEMAAASGLPLLPPQKRNPEKTSTFGTGELIRQALDAGHRKFVIGVGGSATNDGGIGAIAALGARFIDKEGNLLSPIGENLINIHSIDTSMLHPAIKDSSFRIMCDIDNPLLGENGAAFVFSPQKGASPEQVIKLEAGMKNYAGKMKELFGIDPSFIPGAGAAGGLAAGLMLFLKGTLSSGINTVLSLSNFEEQIKGADYCITGEGRADGQSAHGKVLWGVGTTCKKQGIPVIALAGCLGEGYEELFDLGITKIYTAIEDGMTLEYAMSHAEEQIKKAANRLFTALL